ncbi:MAG: zinc ABC transporter solute-binding protein [Proteobacteria bacterium]|nr:zinc ABC transporter solute-binding protein [Pseudomonadota bacterium]
MSEIINTIMSRSLKTISLWGLFFLAVPLTYAAPLQVFVTIAPQKYFLQKIGGDLVNVKVLVRPGADPHTYEPSPRQMVAMGRAQLYFTIGTEFERIWLPKLEPANPELKFIAQDRGIAKIKMLDIGDHHDHDDHNDKDPHIWLSPPLVKQQIQTILSALVAEDPENSKIYQENFARFLAEIDQLNFDLKRLFSGRKINFAVFHPSWGYFAQAFGLRQIAIEVEGKSPKPRQLEKIIRELQTLKIKTLFVQPQFSQRSAKIVARAAKTRIGVLDSMSENWEDNLREAARLILQSN